MSAALLGTTVCGSAADAEPGTADGLPTGRRDAVVVREVVVPVEGQAALRAWLVGPSAAAPNAQAGILWLHWLGEIHGDRSEYLAEAVQLAGAGTVSLLPQGTFPWVGDPLGDERDVAAVQAQAAAYRAALDHLRGLRAVDPSRVAVVGHDYGAMYGALAADGEVAAMVLSAPDERWGTWFARHWLGLEGTDADAYADGFAGLDPVGHLAALGERLLLQWAGNDVYVPPAVREAYAAAAPEARVITYAGVDHELTTRAELDRTAFLRSELRLG